jgi:hypothetical protein
MEITTLAASAAAVPIAIAAAMTTAKSFNRIPVSFPAERPDAPAQISNR